MLWFLRLLPGRGGRAGTLYLSAALLMLKISLALLSIQSNVDSAIPMINPAVLVSPSVFHCASIDFTATGRSTFAHSAKHDPSSLKSKASPLHTLVPRRLQHHFVDRRRRCIVTYMLFAFVFIRQGCSLSLAEECRIELAWRGELERVIVCMDGSLQYLYLQRTIDGQ